MEKEIRFNGDEFRGYLKELVDNANFVDSKEKGIAKLVIDKGYSALSEKQRYVFDNSMISNYNDDCKRCGLEIPWSEMSGADINGGYCGWCWKVAFDNKV